MRQNLLFSSRYSKIMIVGHDHGFGSLHATIINSWSCISIETESNRAPMTIFASFLYAGCFEASCNMSSNENGSSVLRQPMIENYVFLSVTYDSGSDKPTPIGECDFSSVYPGETRSDKTNRIYYSKIFISDGFCVESYVSVSVMGFGETR